MIKYRGSGQASQARPLTKIFARLFITAFKRVRTRMSSRLDSAPYSRDRILSDLNLGYGGPRGLSLGKEMAGNLNFAHFTL